MFRSLVLEWPDDATVWGVSDEYMLGESFLVCPVLDASGTRDVYLPEAKWVDFWSGRVDRGTAAAEASEIPVIEAAALSSGMGPESNLRSPYNTPTCLPKARRFSIVFDDSYPGFDKSELKSVVNL